MIFSDAFSLSHIRRHNSSSVIITYFCSLLLPLASIIFHLVDGAQYVRLFSCVVSTTFKYKAHDSINAIKMGENQNLWYYGPLAFFFLCLFYKIGRSSQE